MREWKKVNNIARLALVLRLDSAVLRRLCGLRRVGSLCVEAGALAARAARVSVGVAHRAAAVAVAIHFRDGRVAEAVARDDVVALRRTLVVVLVDVEVAVRDVVAGAVATIVLVELRVRLPPRRLRQVAAVLRVAAAAAVALSAALLAAVRVLAEAVRLERVVRALRRALVQLLLRIVLAALVCVGRLVPARCVHLLRRGQRIVAAAIPVNAVIRSLSVAIDGRKARQMGWRTRKMENSQQHLPRWIAFAIVLVEQLIVGRVGVRRVVGMAALAALA